MPASMTMMSSVVSMTVMFLPISSTPPSGIMRITPGAGGGILTLFELELDGLTTPNPGGRFRGPNLFLLYWKVEPSVLLFLSPIWWSLRGSSVFCSELGSLLIELKDNLVFFIMLFFWQRSRELALSEYFPNVFCFRVPGISGEIKVGRRGYVIQ